MPRAWSTSIWFTNVGVLFHTSVWSGPSLSYFLSFTFHSLLMMSCGCRTKHCGAINVLNPLFDQAVWSLLRKSDPAKHAPINQVLTIIIPEKVLVWHIHSLKIVHCLQTALFNCTVLLFGSRGFFDYTVACYVSSGWFNTICSLKWYWMSCLYLRTIAVVSHCCLVYFCMLI